MDVKKMRGLSALVRDAVEHGSSAVQRVHMETTRRPFVLLECIPAISTPVRGIHAVHDLYLDGVYGTIRLVNRAVAGAVDAALSMGEPRA
jgi:hypothetical protein